MRVRANLILRIVGLSAISAVIVIVFFLGIDQHGVIGSDDRVPLSFAEAPWIGEISPYTDRRLAGACTATLVSTRLVLSSAHCTFTYSLFDTRQISTEWFFFPHKITDMKSSPRKGRIVAWGGRKFVQGDWVVILLEESPSSGIRFPQLGRLPKAGEKIRGDLFGFPIDKAIDDLYFSKSCSVWINYLGLLQTDCDTANGMSGGPFVTRINGVETLLGVNSVTLEVPSVKWNLLASAKTFGPVVSKLIQAERSGTLEDSLRKMAEDEFFIIPQP